MNPRWLSFRANYNNYYAKQKHQKQNSGLKEEEDFASGFITCVLPPEA